MVDTLLIPLGLSLAAACIAAAIIGRGRKNEKRDARRLMAASAALGGAGLMLLALMDFT